MNYREKLKKLEKLNRDIEKAKDEFGISSPQVLSLLVDRVNLISDYEALNNLLLHLNKEYGY